VARPSSDGALFSYRAKVERPARTFLFGGTGLQAEVRSNFALILRVDETGDPIRIGLVTLGAGPQDVVLGQLDAGQSTIIALDSLLGVFAECGSGHSFVDCAIVPKP
jgi:hypothetical protein